MSCHCGQLHSPISGPAVGGYFFLVSHQDRRVDAYSFGDRLLLLFFGFTHCEIVCRRELAKIDSALDRLGEMADRIQPLYVTVDPERDSPAVLRDFLSLHPRFVGLTGTRAEIDDAMRSFRVFAQRRSDENAPDGYLVPHTTITYLAAPGGQVIAHFLDSSDAKSLAAALLSRLQATP
ncbi:SCO family protein [Paucibacter sp. R3-3]|uniref:SCO family protein n=1 Tax=Roseateles agri TaxID=3098619 RepID=A0ABU5DT02_9BURK|nr:SCO family protein [Paucibacter sp. R3-3]MDY0749013.1 SCO family protein [Paucibacter sp. R3-3]